MYLAELHGKLPSSFERMEDILTSNVFSFFKYSSRDIFLRAYLKLLEFSVSIEDANNAEFIFWPRLKRKTEPDLVIRVGKYYILIESKYFSDFNEGLIETDSQLLREIEAGKIDAKNYNLEFYLIAITGDYYEKKEKFKIIPQHFRSNFKWTNWQKVTLLIESILEKREDVTVENKSFASDLYKLLVKKNLRSFRGTDFISGLDADFRRHQKIFFEARTAIFRGDFIGFVDVLYLTDKIHAVGETLFFHIQRRLFTSLDLFRDIIPIESPIFYERITKNG